MNTKRIVVKNSDKLSSLVHDKKVVDEYLVYLLDNDTLMSADVVYGSEEKEALINQLIEDNYETKVFHNQVVTEVSFQDFLKQYD